MRELGLLFGSDAHAAATTLAAFFLGIAAGSYAFGRSAARAERPLLGYAALELGIALTALLHFALLDLYHAGYAALFTRLGDQPAAFLAVKGLLSLGVLLPPAFCMGGTLPLMSQHLVRRSQELGRTGALLYALNTAGAALGAGAAAFVLIPRLGATGAYTVAVLTSLAVAGAALGLARRAAPRRPPAAPAPVAALPGSSARALRALAALSGFATLGLEVLFTRMYAQVHQNSVYSFAAVLVAFLVGLALGAAGARALAARSLAPLPVLLALLLGSALWVVAVPLLFVWDTGGLAYLESGGGFARYVARVFASTGVVLLLPTAWLGLLLPYLLKLAESWRTAPGRAVGDLVALNTLGSVGGSLAAGFAVLGAVGLWGGTLLFAACYLAAAAALAAAHRSAAGLAACLATGLLMAGPLDPGSLPRVRIEAERGEELVALREGAAATVAVVRTPDSLRIKLNNHYGLGGSGDRDQEARQAHLPLVLHPSPERAFLLGLGTGITAGAALQHPLERLQVAELVPEVAQLARLHFAPWLSGLFSDPRAQVVAEDGRNVLLGTRELYDVIVADLFLPWKAGAGSLYAREHFAAARERLARGGVYAQWLLLLQFSEREFGAVARTLVESFPRVTLWRGNQRSEKPLVMLLAERDPAPLDPDALARRLSAIRRVELDESGGAGFSAAIPDHPSKLVLAYQGNLSAARELFADSPVNSDGHPFIEYSAPLTQRERRGGEATAFRYRDLLAFYDALFAAVPPEEDPLLARLPPEARGLARAGLELTRSQMLARLGEREAAQAARARYRRALAAGLAAWPEPRLQGGGGVD